MAVKKCEGDVPNNSINYNAASWSNDVITIGAQINNSFVGNSVGTPLPVQENNTNPGVVSMGETLPDQSE
jgi:hypothetical protein